jgi:hypothetical protein
MGRRRRTKSIEVPDDLDVEVALDAAGINLDSLDGGDLDGQSDQGSPDGNLDAATADAGLDAIAAANNRVRVHINGNVSLVPTIEQVQAVRIAADVVEMATLMDVEYEALVAGCRSCKTETRRRE